MLLGIGKAVITPPLGTPLAGFGFRDHGAESVRDDLEVRTFWLQPEETPDAAICIVTADLILFGSQLMAELRQAVQERYGMPPERLLLAASHTHSGPQTGENMVAVGDLVPGTIPFLRDRVIETIIEAQSELSPVTLSAGRGICSGHAVNRRLPVNGGIAFVPNPDGVRDDEVIVLSCHDANDGALRAALFHYTCHPTLMSDYAITADYPGAARRVIEGESGAIAAFLPGCFGDVRASYSKENPDGTGQIFRKGEPEDLAAFGNDLAHEALRIIREDSEPVTFHLQAQIASVELLPATLPTPEALQELCSNGTPLKKKWAHSLLEHGIAPSQTLSMQRIDLADNVSLIAMNGEMCCEFGHFIKQSRPGECVLPLGYSNGLIGYVCPTHHYAEGGYEPIDSTVYFGLPAPFQPDSEARICAALTALLKKR